MVNPSQIDLLKVERALFGHTLLIDLSTRELVVFHREQPMFNVGRMAEHAAQAYYAYMAAIQAARTPEVRAMLCSIPQNQAVAIEVIQRKDSSTHIFDSHYYLERFGSPEMTDDLEAIWLVGSLLKIGDALARHHYFDHEPDVELLYHLRNGVAHGNRFNITKRGLERLSEWPAHDRNARVRVDGADFEIQPSLNGSKVLFEFMGPGDILDLFQSIAVRFS